MTLRDYLRVVVRRLWIIVLIVAVATGSAYYLSSRQTKMYQATAKIMYAPQLNTGYSLNGQISAVDPYGQQDALQSVATAISNPVVQQSTAGAVGKQAPGRRLRPDGPGREHDQQQPAQHGRRHQRHQQRAQDGAGRPPTPTPRRSSPGASSRSSTRSAAHSPPCRRRWPGSGRPPRGRARATCCSCRAPRPSRSARRRPRATSASSCPPRCPPRPYAPRAAAQRHPRFCRGPLRRHRPRLLARAVRHQAALASGGLRDPAPSGGGSRAARRQGRHCRRPAGGRPRPERRGRGVAAHAAQQPRLPRRRRHALDRARHEQHPRRGQVGDRLQPRHHAGHGRAPGGPGRRRPAPAQGAQVPGPGQQPRRVERGGRQGAARRGAAALQPAAARLELERRRRATAMATATGRAPPRAPRSPATATARGDSTC